jgi:hypothetical protein
MKKLNILILLLSVVMLACERDDICAEGVSTTPRLLIEFYDINNPDDLKSVPRISVYGEGRVVDQNGTPTEPTTENSEGTLLFNENSTTVSLPLIVDLDDDDVITTRYILEKDTNLRLDEDDTTQSDVDIIEITYTTNFIYVSRACGYKSVFNNLDIDLEPEDGDTWISNIELVTTEIENENSAHVRILH